MQLFISPRRTKSSSHIIITFLGGPSMSIDDTSTILFLFPSLHVAQISKSIFNLPEIILLVSDRHSISSTSKSTNLQATHCTCLDNSGTFQESVRLSSKSSHCPYAPFS